MSASSRTPRRERSLPGDRDTAGFVVAATVTALTLGVAFGLEALGFENFWLAFVFGFGVVLPFALGGVAALWPEEEAESQHRTPLEELQLQYARGELSETEFERRREVLVETNRETERRNRP